MNKHFLPGTNLVFDLIGLLLRFCQKPAATSTDARGNFLRVLFSEIMPWRSQVSLVFRGQSLGDKNKSIVYPIGTVSSFFTFLRVKRPSYLTISLQLWCMMLLGMISR